MPVNRDRLREFKFMKATSIINGINNYNNIKI